MGVFTIPNRGKFTIINSAISSSTDIRQLMLTDAGSPPSVGTIQDLNTVADLLGVATEAAVAGYARADLASVAVTEDDSGNVATITAAAPVYATPAIGETWEAAAYYIEAGSDAARLLLGVDYFTTAVPTNGQNITGPALLITAS